MNPERWRGPSPARLRLFAALLALLVAHALLEALGAFGRGPDLLEALAASSGARVAFADLSALSLLAAGWIALDRKHPAALAFAAAELFFGAYALLSYLVLRERVLLARGG